MAARKVGGTGRSGTSMPRLAPHAAYFTSNAHLTKTMRSVSRFRRRSFALRHPDSFQVWADCRKSSWGLFPGRMPAIAAAADDSDFQSLRTGSRRRTFSPPRARVRTSARHGLAAIRVVEDKRDFRAMNGAAVRLRWESAR